MKKVDSKVCKWHQEGDGCNIPDNDFRFCEGKDTDCELYEITRKKYKICKFSDVGNRCYNNLTNSAYCMKFLPLQHTCEFYKPKE